MGLLSAGLIIFDVAMDAKDMNTGEWTKKKADNAMIRDVVTMSSLAVMDMAQQVTYTTAEKKGEDLYFLQEEILRPEILPSGGSCRGKVFFPKSGGQYVKLVIPVGSDRQFLTIVTRSEDGHRFDVEKAEPVRFVPLLSGVVR